MPRENETIDCGNGVLLYVKWEDSPENPDFWELKYLLPTKYFRTPADAETYMKSHRDEILDKTRFTSPGVVILVGRKFETPAS